MSDLKTSDDAEHVKKALKRADDYLGVQEGVAGDRVTGDRTLINRGGGADDNSEPDTTNGIYIIHLVTPTQNTPAQLYTHTRSHLHAHMHLYILHTPEVALHHSFQPTS